MITDPWNPTADEIKAWAFSEDLWPEQDWDLAVNDGRNDFLLIQLACDESCPKRDFFLHSIYFMVGDSVYSNAPVERIEELRELISKVPHEASSEIDKWRREAMDLLRDPSKFEYDYWCDYMFKKNNSEQSSAGNIG